MGPGPKGVRSAPTTATQDRTSEPDFELVIYIVMPIVTLVLLGVSGVIGYRVWQEYKAKEDALEMQIRIKNASETNNSLKDETSLTEMSRLPT